MAEKHIERKVVTEAFRRWGLLSIKLTPEGQTGYPDRLFFIRGGRPLLIEFKIPGEEPRPKQLYIHKLLRSLGYDIETHEEVGTAIKAIERVVHRSRRR